MDPRTEKIYNTIFSNAILFLNRGIVEIVNKDGEELENDQAIVSTLFIQMSIELGMKAFLIKESGVRSILRNNFQNKTTQEILDLFHNNKLHTKKYWQLKKYIKDNDLIYFTDTDFIHLDQFQKFRNSLMHFNLFLHEADRYDLKYESIYAVVHIIIPFLSKISYEFESPTRFCAEHVDPEVYKKLIMYSAYIDEMENLAKKNTGYAYQCLKCSQQTFSPENSLCYCCNLEFVPGAEYIDCKSCGAKKAIIFDSLNIGLNNNMINGLCLNCGDKPEVFKCPECEEKLTFYGMSELTNTCYKQCKNQ